LFVAAPVITQTGPSSFFLLWPYGYPAGDDDAHNLFRQIKEFVSKIIKNNFVAMLVQAHGLLCNRGAKSKERE
jgi:hypothetical protein